MQFKNVLRKSTEAGVVLIAVAVLVLSGCLGSGGSSTSGTAASAGATAVANFIADGLSTGNVSWNGTPNWTAVARGTKLTPAATTATYTVATTSWQYMSSVPATAWGSTTASGVPAFTYYDLTTSGWSLRPNTPASAVNNGTSVTMTQGAASTTFTITQTDLSNQAVVCTNPIGSAPVGAAVSSVPCAVASAYPSGSSRYTLTAPAPSYVMTDFANAATIVLTLSPTDATGSPLTTVPAIGSTFCLNGGGGVFGTAYVPIVGAATGSPNYNVRTVVGGCTAANISTAVAGAAGPTDVLVSVINTGIAGVSVLDMGQMMYGSTQFAYNATVGKWLAVTSQPAVTYHLNKTAANVQLIANGIPALP